MQSIWSRAVQIRSCRCHSCLHAATTFARRTTTAASKRRLKASDVFTACYSAMFATAALVDMKFKDDRRKQWDLAIAEAKSSRDTSQLAESSSALESVTHTVESSHSDLQSLILSMPSSNWDEDDQRLAGAPTLFSRVYPILQSPSKRQPNSWEACLMKSDSPFAGASVVRDPQILEQGVVQEDTEDVDLDDAPQRKSRLTEAERSVRQEQMVLKLVARFLVSKEPVSTASAEATHPHPHVDHDLEVKIIADRVARLNNGYPLQPKYSLRKPELHKERDSLNHSITEVLSNEESNPGNIGAAVTHICYKLLISSAPPGVDTYNIMLTYFTRLQQHRLAQAVVDSFFEDTRFSPKSSTLVAILDHYAAKGDTAGFKLMIKRMRGMAAPTRVGFKRLCSSESCPAGQSWGVEANATQRKSRLFAKVQRDTAIFRSLIIGSMRVLGVRRAAWFLKVALREGHSVAADLVLRVAQLCLSERNKEAATALLAGIISQWHQCHRFWELEPSAGSGGIILRLLELCNIEPLLIGNHCRPGALRKIEVHFLRAWLVSVQLEVIDEYIKRSAKNILDLEILLATSLSKISSNEQINLKIDPGSTSLSAHRAKDKSGSLGGCYSACHITDSVGAATPWKHSSSTVSTRVLSLALDESARLSAAT